MVVDENTAPAADGESAQSKKAAKKLAKELERKQKKAEHKVCNFNYYNMISALESLQCNLLCYLVI